MGLGLVLILGVEKEAAGGAVASTQSQANPGLRQSWCRGGGRAGGGWARGCLAKESSLGERGKNTE